ncbi:MAG: 2-dehydro-3-deoxygluconokinase [Phenylobacterium sp.]|jgi:2-dehydro-3-deoxygluconokinase
MINSTIKICFFGECMLETHQKSATNTSNSKATLRFGGDTLNTALYLARLNQDNAFTVYYATGVGCDSASEQLVAQWQSEGIDTSLVLAMADKTLGSYHIETDDHGERHFSYDRDNSAARDYFRQGQTPLEKMLGQCNYFYFSGISLAILPDEDKDQLLVLLTQFKANGGKVIFDNNYRVKLWGHSNALIYYRQVMQLADMAFLTDDDEMAVYGDASVDALITRVQQLPCAESVIKQGAAPCIILTKGEVISVASEKVSTIVDTCAAGDAFAAGYLAQRLTGASTNSSPQDAARAGHRTARQVIQHFGAIVDKDLWLE